MVQILDRYVGRIPCREVSVILGMTLNCIKWRSPSFRALGSVEYPFIASPCRKDLVLYSLMKEWMKRHNAFLYKKSLSPSLSHTSRKVRNSVCVWERQTETNDAAGGEVLWRPFFNPCCDSIFRALHPCFFDGRFSTRVHRCLLSLPPLGICRSLSESIDSSTDWRTDCDWPFYLWIPVYI